MCDKAFGNTHYLRPGAVKARSNQLGGGWCDDAEVGDVFCGWCVCVFFCGFGYFFEYLSDVI